jgi:circadian clock protein KaiC
MDTLARGLEQEGATAARTLPKAPTGIAGLDEILGGGLPQGRPTLICGSAGCGKTLMAVEFLVRGAMDFREPGVFMSFEEGAEELIQNVRSLGFDLDDLAARNLLGIDYVHVERGEIEETGEYDLDGLFIRLGYVIDSIGAKRVVLDTLEALFSSLTNTGILRAELRRLFRWLKDKGVTAVITGERGDGALTRYGLEEYISDCVILLDHRVNEQLAIRRLRVVKYRGSLHGTNEYPFIIDERGIEVLPITSLGLEHGVSTERVSTGIPALDQMLGGEGYFRGSSLLISGGAGTGKTSLAAHFVAAACNRGERCIYFAFEESQAQIVRNMRSLGLDLEPAVRQELLRFHAARPTLHGLERHLVLMHKAIRDFQPEIVVLDPVTNFLSVGTGEDVKAMLMRLLDFLKIQQITLLLTSLSHGAEAEVTDVGISSLIDTWMLVRQIELSGERNRGLYVLKSRGMPHSNQVRELVLSARGIELTEAYLGPEGALTGSARLAQEARERREATVRRQEIERARLDLERRRQALEAKMASLRLEFEAEEEEMRRLEDREEMATARQANPAAGRRRRQARGE